MSDGTADKKNPAPNPFDPDSLRVSGDINTVGAEKLLVRIAVRKPTKQEYFRVYPIKNSGFLCNFGDQRGREFYLVTRGCFRCWLRMSAMWSCASA